jgi:hypothetical protein
MYMKLGVSVSSCRDTFVIRVPKAMFSYVCHNKRFISREQLVISNRIGLTQAIIRWRIEGNRMSINWEPRVTTEDTANVGKCKLCGYDRSYSHCTLTWCQYYQKAIDVRENSYSVDGDGYLIGQPQDAYVSARVSPVVSGYHIEAKHSSQYMVSETQLAEFLLWSGFIFESGFEHSSSLAYEMAFSYFMC